jgi:tetratricopeptide (TPR) repeat protein
VGERYGGDHLDFRGGEFNGSFIAKAEYRESAPAPSALDALPTRAVGFTGRDGELRALLDAFDPSSSGVGSEAVVVAAVSGLGGIGKTALAVEAGHVACGKGWFPGGVLFVDLHGYDEEPVTAGQALEALLRALGTEPEHIPTGVDARAALYRSALAARARERGPVLILADNASSPAQVRPLLPGGGKGHRLLVTSRDRLPQLNARLLALDELTQEEAYDLLDRALRIADPADSRVVDDSEAAGKIAALCGYLPLALQIAAALLVLDSDKPAAELASELSEFRERLVHLDDGERSVRAAFDLSYRRLPPEQARLLRLLTLAPGPDVSTEVVTVLAGTDTAPIRALEALSRTHLVERVSGRGRWRSHDLVRAFGMGLVAARTAWAQEGMAARERLLDHYASWADEADVRLRWRAGEQEPNRFATLAEALAWLDAERAGLVAAVQWAGEDRLTQSAVRLAQSLADYLDWRGFHDDLITVARHALDAARRLREPGTEARAWNDLGNALRVVGRFDEAIEAHVRALYQAAGDRMHEPAVWNDLGIALLDAGRLAEAIDALTGARDLYRGQGDHGREAMVLDNLGNALQRTGRPAEAIEVLLRARDLSRDSGDGRSEALRWNKLGLALQDLGRSAEAKEAFVTSLGLCRELKAWYGAGWALENLARLHETMSDVAEARSAYLQSADAFTRANFPLEAARSQARAQELTP